MVLAYSSKYVFNRDRGCFVYYEVFIDVLFVINFVMDYFLLQLACRLLGHSATWPRSLAGAAIGAAGRRAERLRDDMTALVVSIVKIPD